MTPQNPLTSLISDYISDSLANDGVTARELAESIKAELREWAVYHRVQMEKAERVLELLKGQNLDYITGLDLSEPTPPTSVTNDWWDNDKLTYKPYIPSDKLEYNIPGGDDTIKFTL